MNNDLISREALKKKLSDKDYQTYTHEYGYAIPTECVMNAIDNAPTVAVDCKDCDGYEAGYSAGLKDAERPQGECRTCIHRDPEDKKCDCGHDIQWQLPRQDDWFCADGER